LKKLSSFIVAVLLLLSFGISGLLYVVYDVAQFYDKMEAEINIGSKEHLQVIKLPLKEFKGKDQIKEVWAGGRLYDVSSYTIVKDTAIILAFHDEDEEGLVNSITESFDPYNSYVYDNSTNHIYKHHIHPPVDNNILVAPYSINFMEKNNPGLLLARFIEYSPHLYSAIVKPPPRLC